MNTDCSEWNGYVELNPSNFPTNAKSDGSDLRFELLKQ